MGRTLSFGQRIGLGFAAVMAFTVLVAVLAVYSLRAVVAEKDRVINVYAQNLIDVSNLDTVLADSVAGYRGFFLTRDQRFLDEYREQAEKFRSLVGEIEKRQLSADEAKSLMEVSNAWKNLKTAVDPVIDARKGEAAVDTIANRFQDEVYPKFLEARKAIDNFVKIEERQMEQVKKQATDSASFMTNVVIAITIAAVIVAGALALFLSRTLSRQIGSAVQHIQSSSSELQAAANQQSTGSREQATSVNEVATTIKELVATARQISESAQRVAGIAGETARGARAGDQTMQNAQEAVANIKRQVDIIVTHMLELGRKSQQIGGILELINELAEQTNILAINASIEAAGAGDAGRRFAVVADEIRKLADRVGGSTKEIKILIDEIRSAVHTTVMATESGSKAVEAGTRQFGDVSAGFQQIVRLVETTTEAAREIELSTKQQTTAVEQVNVAVANVAQAAKESEASATQTLQTVSELTTLSRDLSRLIQPESA